MRVNTMAKNNPQTSTARANAYTRRENKRAEKLRNLSAKELASRERDATDELFRLKFQMAMGQSESLKKIHELRQELARVKTIRRGRELEIEPTGTEKK